MCKCEQSYSNVGLLFAVLGFLNPLHHVATRSTGLHHLGWAQDFRQDWTRLRCALGISKVWQVIRKPLLAQLPRTEQ